MTSPHEQASDWFGRMHGPDAKGHRAAFAQWLAADPRNREAYAKLETAWDQTDIAGETSFGDDRALEPYGPRFGLTMPRIAVAAAAAAAIVLAVFIWPGAHSPVPPSVQAAQLMQTRLGEISTIDLPDGSKVTLDTDSQVRIRFASDIRRVELMRGRARFEVRADPTRMFIVDAGDRQVAASGGRFDAAVLSKGIRLAAWSGPLDIRNRGATLTSAVFFRLEQGRSFTFAPGQGVPPQAPLASKGADQWPDGMLVFHGTPLSGVLAATNRYSRKRIVLGDPALGELRVTGTFRPLPVDALAASLVAAFDLRADKGLDGNIVLKRL